VAVDLIACDDGYSIALHHLGGRGPTLLLVHAASLCASVYRPLAAELAGDFSCIAVDLRGHGRSRGDEQLGFSWRRLGKDITNAIDHVEGPMFGFGHSLGATALLLAAAQRRERVTAVVAYEPVVLATAVAVELAESQAVRAERRHAGFPSVEDARSRLSSRPPLDRVHPDALEGYLADGFWHRSDGSVDLVLTPIEEAALYRAGIGLDLDADLTRLDCAVKLVTGERNENALALGAGHLASTLQNAARTSLSGGGHFGPLEDPHSIGELIRRAFATPAA
jgi:pimeloyl-ACP methyl ester carboxylesterase